MADEEKTLVFQAVEIAVYDELKERPGPYSREAFRSDTLFMDHFDAEDDSAGAQTDSWDLSGVQSRTVMFGRLANHQSVVVKAPWKPFFFLEVSHTYTLAEQRHMKRYLARMMRLQPTDVEIEKLTAARLKFEPHPQSSVHRARRVYWKIRLPSVAAAKRAYYTLRKKKPGDIPNFPPSTNQNLFNVYEWNLTQPASKFCDDAQVTQGAWLHIPYNVLTPAADRASHADLEFVCHDWRTITMSHTMEIAPLKVLSFDFECESPGGGFPDALKDEDIIIGVGNSLWTFTEDVKQAERVYFCVRETCLPPNYTGPPTEIRWFATEKEMLLAWLDWLVDRDPDILTGYNIDGFDIGYLSDRLDRFAPGGDSRAFYLSRLWGVETRPAPSNFSSSAYGTRESLTWTTMPGRVVMDALAVIRREKKLRSYSLDNVAKALLDIRKIDLPKDRLFRLCRGSPTDRGEIAVYCIRDCDVVLELVNKLALVYNLFQMAHVTFTRIQDLIWRGQQEKSMNLLVYYSHQMGFVLPEAVKVNRSYEGATVLDPVVGFYEDPVAVCDFASLYPSMMIDSNLCYSTEITNPAHMNLPGVETKTIVNAEGSHTFVQNFEGVLPKILRNLLTLRKQVKKEMKKATGLTKKVLNGRQLALKVTANSLYGFTGTGEKGKYPCFAIANSTTALGRQHIEATVKLVQNMTCPGGPPRVLYGDTDSVMVQFPAPADCKDPVQYSFDQGNRLADLATATFGKDVVLEMEKVFLTWLLLSKKRYVGMALEYLGGKAKLDAKGLTQVRRDGAPFACKLQSDITTALLDKRDRQLAMRHVVDTLVQIVEDTIPLDQYVLSARLKAENEYASDQLPHLRVVHKMRRRDPGSEPKPGDRVQYVIVTHPNPKAKVYEKAEDPGYVRTHPDQAQVDRACYITNKTQTPVCDIVRAIFPHPEPIFQVVNKLITDKIRTTALQLALGRPQETVRQQIERTIQTVRTNQATYEFRATKPRRYNKRAKPTPAARVMNGVLSLLKKPKTAV